MGKNKGHGGGGGGGGHDAAGGMRWLLTYSDVVTLLLALFIYLFSISKIDAEKLRIFSNGIQSLFGIGGASREAFLSDASRGGSGALPDAKTIAALKHAKEDAKEALARVKDEVEKKFREMINTGVLNVQTVNGELIFRLKAQVMFEPGRADLKPNAAAVLFELARYLNELPNKIRVEGHTDNTPIGFGSLYPTNWELSSARATSVVRYFIEFCDMQPERIVLAAYAQYKPLKPNKADDGNPENRRVEIVVMKNS